VESLLELPASCRCRPVHVLANDTLVESPVVQDFVDNVLYYLKSSLKALHLPFVVTKTTPEIKQRFWVNLIGRGYPAPTRMFRWCTDRMKIRPTTSYIKKEVSEKGDVILLLGVRRGESSERAKSAKKYDKFGRLNRHNNVNGCYVFRPILELSTYEVWDFLFENIPPWGGTYDDLINLYKDAADGDCPLVIDPDDAPSCGSSSIRFGCWTCTVVEKDKSFRNTMEKGYEHLEPMADFRDWLKDFCYTPKNRMKQRRNGEPGNGPLTFEARQKVYEQLKQLEDSVKIKFITDEEKNSIQAIWSEDQARLAVQKADRVLQLLERIK
jgi:DNA sulfur modification protein DndC